ncbi:hypothetical protein BA6E_12461 [Bacteroidales bacterium 6E]|nr:hypothetical protein BA6E_12461 [Bacteroidales bacterium 6E]
MGFLTGLINRGLKNIGNSGIMQVYHIQPLSL